MKLKTLWKYVFIAIIFIFIAVQTEARNVNSENKVKANTEENILEADKCSCSNGKCENEGGKLVCKCPPGYGNYTSSYCKKCDCGKDSHCIFREKNWFNTEKICICKVGYEQQGEVCKGTCKINPCLNHGKCVVKNNDIECQCQSPFTGHLCEENDKCSGFKCENGGTCEVKGGKAVCNCSDRFTGDKCQKDKCSDFKCENGGKCEVKGGKVVCNCSDRFTGDKCQKDKCSDFKCENGGKCDVKGGKVVCNCSDRFTGNKCQKDKCSDFKCENGGKCDVKGGKVVCNCSDRFTGDKCQKDKCSDFKCENGGKCDVKGGKVVCNCSDRFTGDKCQKDKCSDFKCENGGKCDVKGGKAVCNCSDRFTGDKCQKDKCSDFKCENGGKCDVKGGKTVCNCSDRFTGDKCQKDVCSPNPCQKDGKCTGVKGKATCQCKDPYTGPNCTVDVCSPNPCQHEGKCKGTKGKATCQCNVRYTGVNCTDDKCAKFHCQNSGTCGVTKNGQVFCKCAENFVGDKCEIECKCKNGKCQDIKGKMTCVCNPEYGLYKDGECRACDCGKGANCTFDPGWVSTGKKCICPKDLHEHNGKCIECKCENGKCQSIEGQVSCICNPEYGLYDEGVCKACECGPKANCTFSNDIVTDKECICPKGWMEHSGKCVDTDTHNPCHENPCKNGGSCEKNGVEAVCKCLPGFGGKMCEEDPCSPNPCGQNGNCSVEGGVVKCTCKGNYGGDRCDKDLCTPNPCGKNGICGVKDGNIKCNCTGNYGGERCDKDLCKPNACSNRGTCKVINGKVNCICRAPYTGDNCEIDPCSSNPCGKNGKCSIENSGIKCTCTGTYGGDRCQKNLCSPDPCNFRGKCSVLNGEFVCNCRSPYGGKDCGKNLCSPDPCNKRGKCRAANNQFICDCKSPYSGKKCEKDLCSPDPCNNRGNCSAQNGKFKCDCRSPFTGDNCEREFSTSAATPTVTVVTIDTTTIGTTLSTTHTTTDTTTPTTNLTTTDRTTVTITDSNTDSIVNTTSNSTDELMTLTTNYPVNKTDDEDVNTTLPTTLRPLPTTVPEINDTLSSTSKPESVTTIDDYTTPTKGENNCKSNPCKNGGTCIQKKDSWSCLCPYPYGGNTCVDSHWCAEGLGKTLCEATKCVFNFKTNIGTCSCPGGEFYNYDKKECQALDLCPLMSDKCKGANEMCKESKCYCMKNFIRNKERCVPNFCESSKNVCSSNTTCEENVENPENVKCVCKSNEVFNGEFCLEVNKCDIPHILGCQQICNASTESCECTDGYSLQKDGKSCLLSATDTQCNKNCSAGICHKYEGNETCICPPTHVYKNESCEDLCSANSIPSGMCPNNDCEPHSTLGFRCKCYGLLTYDTNNITCRRKLMCSEGHGTEVCYNRSAKCVEDFDSEDGFRCDCGDSYEMDIDGICKNKCDLKKHQDKCHEIMAICDMEGSEAKCKCPPLVTTDNNGLCNELAKASYMGSIPFSKNKYGVKNLHAPTISSTPDYSKMVQDLRNSMLLLYGDNYKFADILNCSDGDSSLNCTVEIQFKSDPMDQVKLIGDSNTCISNGSDTCFIPPELVLRKKEVTPGLLTPSDPCTEEIKFVNCGGEETVCNKTEGDSNNFECTCNKGFESYGILHPFTDWRTVIHRCRDINECVSLKACPNRTRCVNTYGSYECLCQEGYKPLSTTNDPKASGCVDLCHSVPCDNGKCEVNGLYYTCKCDDGYMGEKCDKKVNLSGNSKGLEVGLIILSTIVIPLVLFSIYMIYKYRILNKSSNASSYLDDVSNLSMQPLRTGLR